jgi:hypothetical protein
VIRKYIFLLLPLTKDFLLTKNIKTPMNLKPLLILFALSLAIFSCKKEYDETKLSEDQKKMNVYKTGDSITFKEMNTGELYGFKVIESKVYSKVEEKDSPSGFPSGKKQFNKIEYSDLDFLVNNKYSYNIRLSSSSQLTLALVNKGEICNKTGQSCYKLDLETNGPLIFKDSLVTINEFDFAKVMDIKKWNSTPVTQIFAENYGIVQIKDSTQNLILNIVNPVKLK